MSTYSRPPVSESPAPTDIASEETSYYFSLTRFLAQISFFAHVTPIISTRSSFTSFNSSPVLREPTRNVSNTSDVVNDEESGPLPVVKLPENGVLLHSLLTFIFPVDSIFLSTSEKIIELLAVTQKYQMKQVLNHIRGIIALVVAQKDPTFVRPETAHGIYLLAQIYELREKAVHSA